MFYTVECSASDFKFWGGAADFAALLTNEEMEDVFDEFLGYAYDEQVTATTINDLFWFEQDAIAEYIGYEETDEATASEILWNDRG